MGHEFETRVLGAEDIRRSNEQIGQLSIAAYQIMSKEPVSEFAQRLRLQDFRAIKLAQAAIPHHVDGQYELVFPIENDK